MLVEVGTINWYEYIKGFGLIEESKKRRRSQNKHRVLNVYTAIDI